MFFFPGQCAIERQRGDEKATAILGRHDSAIGAEYHHGYCRIQYKKNAFLNAAVLARNATTSVNCRETPLSFTSYAVVKETALFYGAPFSYIKTGLLHRHTGAFLHIFSTSAAVCVAAKRSVFAKPHSSVTFRQLYNLLKREVEYESSP